MAKTRQEWLYEQLKEAEERSRAWYEREKEKNPGAHENVSEFRELKDFIGALDAFNEHMETLSKPDENGKLPKVTKEQEHKTSDLRDKVQQACIRYKQNMTMEPSLPPKQKLAVSQQMEELNDSVGKTFVAMSAGKSLDDGYLSTAKRARATELRQLLKDRTSFIRGSSDNYRSVEAALEAVSKGGQEPTREQLLAIKEAAEKYTFEKEEAIRDREKPRNDYEKNRIDAVKKVLAYANEGLGLMPKDNQRELINAELSGRDTVDVGVDQIVQHYKPTPERHQPTMDNGGYTEEQFNKLETLDVKGVEFGGKQITDKEFATVGIMAMMTKDIGGKYVAPYNGGNLIEIDEQERDPIFGLANSSLYVMDIGMEGSGRLNCGLAFTNINEGRKVAYSALEKYKAGDKEPLAKLIGEGVNNSLNLTQHVSTDQTGLSATRDQRIFIKFINEAVDLAKKDPQLMQLASQNGLTKENLKKAEALRRIENVQRMASKAEQKIEQGNLTKVEKEACVAAVLRNNAMGTATRTAVKERSEVYIFEDMEEEERAEAIRKNKLNSTPVREKAKAAEKLCDEKRSQFDELNKQWKQQRIEMGKRALAGTPDEAQYQENLDKLTKEQDARKAELGEEEFKRSGEKNRFEVRQAELNNAWNIKIREKGEEELMKTPAGRKLCEDRSKLELEKDIAMQKGLGYNMADIGIPAPVAQLGGKGALAQMKQQVNSIIPDKSGLLKLDGEQLLETLKDPKLVAPDEAAKQKYANIYNPQQQPKVEQKQQPQAGGPVV